MTSPIPISQFVAFPKIPRLKRTIVITEKIDGTNASVHIGEDGEFRVGSRSRYITPEDDNYGFARWAHEHKNELLDLGPGRHYGEWWGSGIQRRYGLADKKFSLFNTGRWSGLRPECCDMVPVLYVGDFDTLQIDEVFRKLSINGSVASPGFMQPEGIVVFHPASGCLWKRTFEHDEGKDRVQGERYLTEAA